MKSITENEYRAMLAGVWSILGLGKSSVFEIPPIDLPQAQRYRYTAFDMFRSWLSRTYPAWTVKHVLLATEHGCKPESKVDTKLYADTFSGRYFAPFLEAFRPIKDKAQKHYQFKVNTAHLPPPIDKDEAANGYWEDVVQKLESMNGRWDSEKLERFTLPFLYESLKKVGLVLSKDRRREIFAQTPEKKAKPKKVSRWEKAVAQVYQFTTKEEECAAIAVVELLEQKVNENTNIRDWIEAARATHTGQ